MTKMNYPERIGEELQLELDKLQKEYNELLVKEERYRLLAEHARDVIWTMKLDGTITYISPAVTQLRGLTVEEAMNQSTDQILTPDSLVKVVKYIQDQIKLFTEGMPLESFRDEVDYYRRDGTIMPAEVIAYSIPGKDFDSVTILGVTRDITERKQFESKLLEQANQLKELNATKDKFFSIIAHDLKNPFSAILGLSELMKNEALNLDNQTLIEFADMIHSSTQQTYNLLQNLLDWANSQQHKFPFHPVQFSLNNLIANEIQYLQMSADQKNIKVIYDFGEEVFVTADEKMISTVIRNLISNAIKFTPREGSVMIKCVMKSGNAEISVTDTGVGMSKNTINQLFRIDNTITSPGTEDEKGTGLGLILCKEFVEKHGGSITVESDTGKGSRFCFTIPANGFAPHLT